MSADVSSCPLCGAEHSDLFDRRIAQEQTITNRLCLDCGLVYQSPRMTGDELETFYQEEYRQLYQGTPGPTDKDLKIQSLQGGFPAGIQPSASTRHLPTSGYRLFGGQALCSISRLPIGRNR